MFWMLPLLWDNSSSYAQQASDDSRAARRETRALRRQIEALEAKLDGASKQEVQDIINPPSQKELKEREYSEFLEDLWNKRYNEAGDGDV